MDVFFKKIFFLTEILSPLPCKNQDTIFAVTQPHFSTLYWSTFGFAKEILFKVLLVWTKYFQEENDYAMFSLVFTTFSNPRF